MIIQSILDNDLYKFTQQKAVLAYSDRYLSGEDIPVRYVFNNRRPEGKFTEEFLELLKDEIHRMGYLCLSDEEAFWLEKNVPFLGDPYIEYLRNYRYAPHEVSAFLKDGELQLEINGSWASTILWEVPLMALISELFFKVCDTDWNMEWQEEKLKNKSEIMRGVPFADFGTRRRRSYEVQDLAVKTLKWKPTGLRQDSFANSFRGTSNVHLAQKHDVKPIGTMAHEFIMGISALEGLRHANRFALNIWSEVFGGNLGIALTDTFGTQAFFNDFNLPLAKLYDGVRHDSGDPLEFAKKVILHYRELGIDPETKTIVFSDGLDCETANSIYDYLKGRIRTSFGIGTHLTNDFQDSKALNMVIKMNTCDEIPVVKLSDDAGKEIGDAEALNVAHWTFNK